MKDIGLISLNSGKFSQATNNKWQNMKKNIAKTNNENRQGNEKKNDP